MAQRLRSGPRARGAIDIIAAFVLILLAGMSFALLTVMSSSYEERRSDVARTRLRYAAEGVVDEALATLRARGPDALRGATGYPRSVADVDLSLQATYGVDSGAIADDLIRLVGVAAHDGTRHGIEVYVRQTRVPSTIPLLFGDRGIVLDSNSTIDTYDSALGTWASQATNLRNGIPYAESGTAVASNRSITVGGNGQVFGDATAGPGYSVTVAGSGYVSGSTSSASSAVTLPPVTAPSIASSGTLSQAGGSVTYPPGDYHWTRWEMTSTATTTIRGPARIVVDDWFVDSNSQIRFDTSGGEVDVYVTGPAVLGSNCVVGPVDGNPAKLRINATGTEERFFIDSNATVIAQIYAPKDNVEIGSNAHVFGSVVGRTLDMDSNGFISVDKQLLALGSGPPVYSFTRESWSASPRIE